MKPQLAIIGAVCGAGLAFVPILFAYLQAPSWPGPIELGLQAMFVLGIASVGAVLGLLVGFVVSLFGPKD